MTISELLQYCMAKPGAEQSVHNDWKATQIKVEDVLFAMVKEVENRPAVSLKTSPELAELLRQQHSDVRPSRHLNKAHWSTVYLDGSLPDSQIYYLVDASYQQAVNLLPEEKRKLLVTLMSRLAVSSESKRIPTFSLFSYFLLKRKCRL